MSTHSKPYGPPLLASLGWRPWLLVLLLLAATGASVAIADDTSDTSGLPPLVKLASGPLYASGARAKPTLTLALSVEYPTVGASYRGTDDYAAGTAYIGYFNPDLCYTYDAKAQQFNPSSDAPSHGCGGAGFSGNFMNWATTSSIDILRYGMTGGDRIVDTESDTVLQRAVLPSNFYNVSQNFPAKTISVGDLNGAVPSGLLGKSDGTSTNVTIHIANCLNRVFFGTATDGSCNSPGNNANLGQVPITSAISAPTQNKCANNEGDTCTLPSGPRMVYYGAGQKWFKRAVESAITCSNTIFGDPAPHQAKACYYDNDILSGDANPFDGSKSGDVNYFLTRVAVCKSMSGATADIRKVNGNTRNFCTLYPNGNYKPTGDLQAYSDSIRIAAFGYLIDNYTTRYGGVLRAPMKYVGPTAYDSDFNSISGGNTQTEWDADTGVFKADPMGEGDSHAIKPRTTAISGVINYLNQFGRTGADGGVYKTDDPVNELYYEALRYLQGLKPTPQATTGITDTMEDGFPVYYTLVALGSGDDSDSDTAANRTAKLPASPKFLDPQPAINGLDKTVKDSYACIHNSIITIGDIHTHYDKSLPGFTDSSDSDSDPNDFTVNAKPGDNMPDFSFWTKVVGGFESNGSIDYIDGSWKSRNTSNTPNNQTPIASLANLQTLNPSDHSNYYMVGAAYWANTHDIRGIPYTGDNSNNAMAWADSKDNQRPGMRVNTYVIDVNESNDSSDLATRQKNQFYLTAKYGGFTTSHSQGDSPYATDDGKAATLWERGVTGDPQTYFLASDSSTMLLSLDNIFAAIASDTASIAGTSTTSASVTVNGGSTGYRASFDPSDWTGNVYPFTISTDADNVVSVSGSGAAAWNASAKINAQTWTDRNLYVGTGTSSSSATTAVAFTWDGLSADQKSAINSDATVGAAQVDYLRGDRTNETPNGKGFRKRKTVLGDIINSGIVYEGAPSAAITDSDYTTFYNGKLTRTAAVYVGANDGMLHAINASSGEELFGYIPSFVVPKLAALTGTDYVHQAYVDSTPAVGEAQLGPAAADWKTVLVSGAGGGGQGVFALDVSDPTAFDASKVLWEFTDKDDADMGNVIGTPGIYKFRTSSSTASPQTTGWYAVVASGVNNYASDGHASTTGNPVIFILDLSKPAGTAWSEGSNYFKITLPQTSTTQATGMANFSVYSSGGVVADIYAGDLQGNLWALDFTTVGTDGWKFDDVTARTSKKPLFIAKTGDETPKLQPIMMAPEITGYGNNLILLFGTGKYIESTDNSSPYLTQTAYAVLDPIGTNPSPATYYRGSLKKNTASNGTITGSTFAWGVPADNTNNEYAGWYFDLPSSSGTGERFVSDFAIYSGTIFANSIIPAAGGCSQGGGSSYVMSLFGGSGIFTSSTVGLLGAPILVTVGTPVVGVSSSSGQPIQTTTIVPIDFGSGGLGSGTATPTTQGIGVRSWRQIFSYKDNKGS